MSANESDNARDYSFMTPDEGEIASGFIRVKGQLLEPTLDFVDTLVPQMVHQANQAKERVREAEDQFEHATECIGDMLKEMPKQFSRHQSMHYLDALVFPILEKATDEDNNVEVEIRNLEEKLAEMKYHRDIARDGKLVRAVEKHLDELSHTYAKGELAVDTGNWKAYQPGTLAEAFRHFRDSCSKLKKYKEKLLEQGYTTVDQPGGDDETEVPWVLIENWPGRHKGNQR